MTMLLMKYYFYSSLLGRKGLSNNEYFIIIGKSKLLQLIFVLVKINEEFGSVAGIIGNNSVSIE
jgi:hypothetical protein